MGREIRFRTLLPVAECGIAALFGGLGLWQRSKILSGSFWGDTTLWESTARFHVWPWPYKFAVISNLPGVLAGLLLSWPLGLIWPGMSEYMEDVPSLLFAAILWYWVGSRLDRRWRLTDKAPWIAVSIFTLVCLAGAFLPMGYTGYLPYGLAVWVVAGVLIGLVRPPANPPSAPPV